MEKSSLTRFTNELTRVNLIREKYSLDPLTLEIYLGGQGQKKKNVDNAEMIKTLVFNPSLKNCSLGTSL